MINNVHAHSCIAKGGITLSRRQQIRLKRLVGASGEAIVLASNLCIRALALIFLFSIRIEMSRTVLEFSSSTE